MYYIIIAAIVILDQIIKYMVHTQMTLNESIPVIEGVFHLTYIQNTGAAFSILEDQRLFLILLPLVLVVGIVIYIARIRKKENAMYLCALALIAAGGLGNLVDRIVRGYVVDFFDFRIWPIFNIADIAVCCGCGLLIIYILFIEGKKEKKNGIEHDTAKCI